MTGTAADENVPNSDSSGSAISADRLIGALDRVSEAVGHVAAGDITLEQWLEQAAELGQRVADLEQVAAEISAAFGLTSAQKRMLAYLQLHVGERVDRRALRGVAQIDDWARRIRELRVEHGWPIVSNAQDSRIPKDFYVLERGEADHELARRWRTANTIRRRAGSGFDRGLEYLKAVYPQAARADEMAYVMKIKDYPRRIREMSEYGWLIVSNVDDPAMAPGSYRLKSMDKMAPRVRKAIALRLEVFNRDKNRCQDCGRTPSRDGIVLHAHHLKMVSEGGDNSLENLTTLCPDCHAGRHAKMRKQDVRDELLQPLGSFNLGE